MKKSYKLAVLGHPIEHSLSPDIHYILAKHAGIEITYDKIDATEESYSAVSKRLIADGYDGYNATMPCKTVAARGADFLSDGARIIGAANTVSVINGQIHADNTDGCGLAAAILRETGWTSLSDKRVLLLGFGGAARSIAAAFVLRGVKLTVLCPTGEMNPSYCGGVIDFRDARGFCPTAIGKNIGGADVLINATPLGMKGSPPFESLSFLNTAPSDLTVCDIVYNPIDTALLLESRRRGLRSVGGLSMLVYQGVEAFAVWTGKYPSDAAINEVFEMLKGRFGGVK